MALPLLGVAAGFIGAMSAGLVRFAISKIGHILGAMGLTMIAYKGMDTAFYTIRETFTNNINGIQSLTISALGSEPVSAGAILMDMMGLIGLWSAANLIVSAAVSAVALKQSIVMLKRILPTG